MALADGGREALMDFTGILHVTDYEVMGLLEVSFVLCRRICAHLTLVTRTGVVRHLLA